ncbi:DUF1803 domain-containing protein [Vagococcus bubulae]|uniref:DUF1803 domain-containing protein n=1 Tax=Vagococcus bubulae TaxID=1977868 RepID=A0A429ZR66_9ENTE|nr:DUF1803 domain-containing protein [Vagococcus bubulae]RST96202.1 hypothetical protein CBF36_00275 [Vagococcus bubulae]
MYQFITLQTEQTYRSLMQDKAFQQVVNFMIEQGESVTLRDIKRALPNVEEIEVIIEIWISAGLITRHHGRYELVGNVISEEKQEELKQTYQSFFLPCVEKLKAECNQLALSTKERALYFLYALHQKIQGNITLGQYMEDTPVLAEIKQLPVYFQQLTGKKTEWLSFESLTNLAECVSLPSFFYEETYRENTKSPQFLALEKQLGDVNESYFLTYVERKLRRIEKGRIISSDTPDIFLASLVTLGYLTIEEHHYKLNVLSVEEHVLEVIHQELDSIIERFDETFNRSWEIMAIYSFLDVMDLAGTLEYYPTLFGFKPL